MLRDTFVIQERLGIGATAEVFAALSRETQTKRALKIFTPLVMSDPDTVKRIEGEVSALQRLSHPNIVRLYGSHSFSEELALELEFVDGSDLRAWRKNFELRLFEPLLWILSQVARGIGCAHEHGILHRDLKPENILISREGDVKLTDFGLARQLDAVTMTKSGLLAGSIGYMAPEMLDGERCSPRSDIFSFGAVAYELLAGVNPFAGPNPQSMMKKMMTGQYRPLGELVPGLPPRVERLVHDCLASNPAARPASIWHVEAELMSLLTASPLLRFSKALVSTSRRQIVLEEAFLEKKRELDHRSEELSGKVERAPWILLAREWSYIFPDSPAPAEILSAMPREKRAYSYRWAAALLLLLVFLGVGFAWRTREVLVNVPEVAQVTDSVAVTSAAPTPPAAPKITPPAPPPSPAGGWIKVMADEDVRVLLDGAEVPRAQWNKIPADAGRRRIRLVKEGFLPIENVIRVSPGKTAVVNAKGSE